MAKSTTTLDMKTSIGRAIVKGRGKQIVNKFNKDFKHELEELLVDLKINQNKLEDLYDAMREAFGKEALTKELMSNSIITQIYDVIRDIDKGDIESFDLNLMNLLQDKGADISYINTDEKIQAISNFLDQYFITRDRFLDSQEMLASSTQTIRGDTPYYGILLSSVRTPEQNKKMDKLLKISQEQFSEFEILNADLFELSMSRYKAKKGETGPNGERLWEGSEGYIQKYQLRKDVSAQEVYDRMRATFGEEAMKTDILDSIFAVNQTDKTAISTRDIFNVLMNDVNDNKDESKGPIGNFAGLGGGRRLEILFSKPVRQQVSKMMQSGNLTKDNLLNFLNDSKRLDTKPYRGSENTYAYATGDVNFNFGNGEVEGWQLKFKGSMPWNGQGYNGGTEAISTLIGLCDQVETNPDMINNIGLNGGPMFLTEQDAVVSLTGDQKALDSLSTMGVQKIMNDYFLSQDWGDYTQVTWQDDGSLGEYVDFF